jgi:uncharacterized protein YPO0396
MEHLIPDQIGCAEGFRLQRLEIYNWGTFNQHVWILEPGGQTALLTGANGSGKSTLVDALLTLLVPSAKRAYNQASGAERRRERDEKTYVRGAYGRQRSEDDPRGTVQSLRGHDAYSVLLAVFLSERLDQHLTLAQVFWHQDGELKKLYIVAPAVLGITTHFAFDGDSKALRQRLKSLGADVGDEFARYSRQFCKLFGLRSDQALDLFGQIVSIKEIGGLNDFVRAHMLEKTDAHERIAQLRANYENLTHAHDAIEKAERQLAQLQPLMAEAAQFHQKQAQIAETERCAAAAPPYFARHKLALLERAITDARTDLDRHEQLRDTLATQLDELREREKRLFAAIENDQAGRRIQQLQQEIAFATRQRDNRRRQAEKYTSLTKLVGLDGYSDEATFHQTRRRTREALPKLEIRLQTLVAERDGHRRDADQLEAVCAELRAEIDSLRQRKSQIPSDDLRIRALLASALGIPEHELPFVGELLKVRDEQRRWEAAIERLLRGYGRQLLVPEPHYRRVSDYVDATDLRGRLVYQRMFERRGPPAPEPGEEMLTTKLEIKPGSACYEWLRYDLIDHWDYVCCETLEQFQRERRALTANGQIKHGPTRHEKDDRNRLGDRRHYVLGWDNREKIAALGAELAAKEATLRKAARMLKQIEEEQKQREKQRDVLRDLLAYDDFAALDWRTDQRQIDELTAERRALESSADQLKELRDQLAEVKAHIAAIDQDRERAQAVVTTRANDIARYEGELSACAAQAGDQVGPADEAARIESDLKGELRGAALALGNIDSLAARMGQYYQNSVRTQLANLGGLERNIVLRMAEYKRDYSEETADIAADIGALDEFGRLLDQIKREDLPRHKQRFKALLNEKVIQDIATFKKALESRVDEIIESIDSLNTSLRTIDYTPATYIQLSHQPSRDAEIREFRNTLRACLPDVGQPRTPEANEASFQRIRALIHRFEQEERWTEKVTDVRRWLDFSAGELYKEDGAEKKHYSDSSGLSGGQKAKLAYTILASAIAYQYGLDQDERRARSFRFVVIDEAFSKSDEDNARYAMQLFKQLDLQLLVVTPLDKTHVVEPFIAACHFVANTVDENDSRVYNLTIQQYHEQKAALESGVLAI